MEMNIKRHLGSVRIDLVGGTLDLWPINLILDGLTINFATSLKVEVVIKRGEKSGIETCEST